MKSLRNNIVKGKYGSFLATSLLLFAYLMDARYYLYENIYKAFQLGNLGPVGARLQVSILMPVLMALGVLTGWLLSFLFRKKTSGRTLIVLYTLCALFAIVFLFFTPYHLQLLMPSQIMQNLAMINCIAVMVFAAVDAALFSWAVFSHLTVMKKQGGRLGGIVLLVCAVLAFGAGSLLMEARGSFPIYVGLYAGILIIINSLHSIIGWENHPEPEGNPDKFFVFAGALTAFLMLAAIVIGALGTQSLIALK